MRCGRRAGRVLGLVFGLLRCGVLGDVVCAEHGVGEEEEAFAHVEVVGGLQAHAPGFAEGAVFGEGAGEGFREGQLP